MLTSAVFYFLKAGQKPAKWKDIAEEVNHHPDYLILKFSKIILTTLHSCFFLFLIVTKHPLNGIYMLTSCMYFRIYVN
jgi:hypothetical protein